MHPVREATMYDTGFVVTPTSKSRTVLTCSLSLETSIAQMHKLGLLTSHDCDGRNRLELHQPLIVLGTL